jgi:hypothetical protein
MLRTLGGHLLWPHPDGLLLVQQVPLRVVPALGTHPLRANFCCQQFFFCERVFSPRLHSDLDTGKQVHELQACCIQLEAWHHRSLKSPSTWLRGQRATHRNRQELRKQKGHNQFIAADCDCIAQAADEYPQVKCTVNETSGTGDS